MKNVKALFLGMLCAIGLVGCGKETASIGIIGGADGPTAILVSSKMSWLAVCGLIALVVFIILVIFAIYRKKNK